MSGLGSSCNMSNFNFLGPFAPYPIPSNVIVTEPVSDNTIDIGTSIKRYRTLYATDVKTTTIETATVTASTSITTPALTVNGQDVQTEINARASGPLSSTAGHLTSFSDTSGLVLSDSGIPQANVVQGPSSATNGNLTVFSGSTGKQIADGGNLLTYLAPYVQGPGSSVSTNLPRFADTTGKLLADSGISSTSLVTSTGTATTSNLASFGASGQVIQDSTILSTQVCTTPGFQMTGAINMQGNNLKQVQNLTGWTTPGAIGTNLLPGFTNMYLNNVAYCQNAMNAGGLPIGYGKYVSTVQVNVQNTTTPTSINSLGAPSLGNLAFPANTMTGPIILMYESWFQLKGNLLDTITFSFILNGTTLGILVVSPPSTSFVDGCLKWRTALSPGGNINYFAFVELPGGSSVSTRFGGAGFSFTALNTFDVQATWSAASSNDNLGAVQNTMIVYGI